MEILKQKNKIIKLLMGANRHWDTEDRTRISQKKISDWRIEEGRKGKNYMKSQRRHREKFLTCS